MVPDRWSQYWRGRGIASCWHELHNKSLVAWGKQAPISNYQFQIKNGKQVVKVTTDLQCTENQETGICPLFSISGQGLFIPSLAIGWFLDIRVFTFEIFCLYIYSGHVTKCGNDDYLWFYVCFVHVLKMIGWTQYFRHIISNWCTKTCLQAFNCIIIEEQTHLDFGTFGSRGSLELKKVYGHSLMAIAEILTRWGGNGDVYGYS